ncbi:MAG: glycosyltransferase [Pseudomonadota bacterium]
MRFAALGWLCEGARVKVLHIITSLDQGGAEAVLCRLVAQKTEGVEYSVISLKGEGFYGATLEASGISPHYFEFARFFQLSSFFEFVRLVRLIARLAPDVVQTWLYHADLIGGLAARMAGCRRVVWGIRSCNLSPELISRFTLVVAWVCARLSGLVPAAIACCSQQAAKEHKALGYSADKFHVIPNGYDLGLFSPSPALRHQVRTEWGIADDEVLLGCVARWDPYKDHDNLLHALSIAANAGTPVRCVLIGGGMAQGNTSLMDLLAKYNLVQSVVLAGSRKDVPAVMNALDVHILPSVSEAFPNVLAEAMACGTPCISTDVGDAALIVGDTGWVVARRDPQALSLAISDAVNSVKTEGFVGRQLAARKRIVENFSLEKMRQAYVELWRSLSHG